MKPTTISTKKLVSCAWTKGKGTYATFRAWLYPTIPSLRNWCRREMIGDATLPMLPARYSRLMNSCSHMDTSDTLARGPRAACSMATSLSLTPPMTRKGRAALYLVRLTGVLDTPNR
jgi:hypothetical protein